MGIYKGNQLLRHDSMDTLDYYEIYNNTRLSIIIRSGGGGSCLGLYSHCKDCPMRNRCPFETESCCSYEFRRKFLLELSEQQQKNAYLILCRHFNISNEDIKAIEDNNEDNYVKLGDTLHQIYHSINLHLTEEEVINIINI